MYSFKVNPKNGLVAGEIRFKRRGKQPWRRMAVFLGRCGIPLSLLVGAAPAEHGPESSKQDLAIADQRPFLDVSQIHSYPIVKIRNLVPTADLPEARHTGSNRQLLFLPGTEPLVFHDQWRSRTDQAHVPFQD